MVIAQGLHMITIMPHKNASSGSLPMDSLQSQKAHLPPSGLVRLMVGHVAWGKEPAR